MSPNDCYPYHQIVHVESLRTSNTLGEQGNYLCIFNEPQHSKEILYFLEMPEYNSEIRGSFSYCSL